MRIWWRVRWSLLILAVTLLVFIGILALAMPAGLGSLPHAFGTLLRQHPRELVTLPFYPMPLLIEAIIIITLLVGCLEGRFGTVVEVRGHELILGRGPDFPRKEKQYLISADSIPRYRLGAMEIMVEGRRLPLVLRLGTRKQSRQIADALVAHLKNLQA